MPWSEAHRGYAMHNQNMLTCRKMLCFLLLFCFLYGSLIESYGLPILAYASKTSSQCRHFFLLFFSTLKPTTVSVTVICSFSLVNQDNQRPGGHTQKKKWTIASCKEMNTRITVSQSTSIDRPKNKCWVSKREGAKTQELLFLIVASCMTYHRPVPW